MCLEKYTYDARKIGQAEGAHNLCANERASKSTQKQAFLSESASDRESEATRTVEDACPYKTFIRAKRYTIKSSYFSRTCALKNTPMMDENLDKGRSPAHKFCASEHPSKTA